MNRNVADRPEIWGGLECTINRIGNVYKDQLEYSGHYYRPGDIESIADLGIRTIRYPVLWEKHQPDKNLKIDWSWADQQLNAIRVSGMTPIVGLLHHGSGPLFTNLLDPEFPHLLAEYAYKVASRYPWIEFYTPVNEPLTTARFSGLYGLWYPHHKNDASFYTMLLNQLKATVLSMEAIRAVNPSAKLVQTEDLGKSYSTPCLAYQANFENERRLLTFDLLTGRLTRNHPQYEYMVGCGIKKEDIDFFQSHAVQPDILGLNYYVTSERWLDERIENYPDQTLGGNGKHRYADTEVVRAHLPAWGGFKILATEIWERYAIPMAITECHLHCTREEQLRWLKEIWDDAIILIARGIPIKAVTAWALLGSFDWNTLLTKTGTQYESGVFDIKTISGQLRPTALVGLLKTLGTGHGNFHPVLSASGWWHGFKENVISNSRPIVILKGLSGDDREGSDVHDFSAAWSAACCQRHISNRGIDRLDEKSIRKLNPWAVIHLDKMDTNLSLICKRMHVQYISFCKEPVSDSYLQNTNAQSPLSVHQINRLLDLIIDGAEGRVKPPRYTTRTAHREFEIEDFTIIRYNALLIT